MIRHLFVYGTLRSDVRHKAHAFIARYFTLVGKAKVRGRLYEGIEYPHGVPDEGEFYITGELYEIKNVGEFDQAMQVLDEYECSYDPPDEPTLFRRELAEVFYNEGIVKAWIYWYNRPVAGEKLIPSGDLLKKDQ